MQSQKQIAIFGSFLTNPRSAEFQMAEELGYLLARHGCRVVCGGHGGIVEPLVAGTVKGGGSVLGVSLAASAYPKRSARMNPQISEIIQVDSMQARLQLFAEADGILRSGFIAEENIDKSPTEIMIERVVERVVENALAKAGLLGRKGVA